MTSGWDTAHSPTYAIPVDYLKINNQFIRALSTNAEDQQIVTAIVSVAHQGTLDELVRLGVDHAQGYFTGPPMPLLDRWKLMAHHREEPRMSHQSDQALRTEELAKEQSLAELEQAIGDREQLAGDRDQARIDHEQLGHDQQ